MAENQAKSPEVGAAAGAGAKALGDVVLKAEHLTKRYPIKGGLFGKPVGYVHALEDVSFEVHKGETFAIVGESGCGKSTTGKCVLRLTEPTEGTVTLDGQDFTALSGEALTEARKKMTLIFQDPYSSLNPRMTVSDIIGEPLDIARTYTSRAERDARVEQVMQEVGLDLSYKYRYPHEFSGGQRQRICIARALALNPEFVVCDEPVSALDVSIQAQIINLLSDLQASRGLTYLFISHDLSVVEYLSDAVGVMYLGGLVEYGLTKDIYGNPLHPYTKALLSAIPVPDPTVKHHRIMLEGSLPSPANPPRGCKFHTRCPFATDRCREEVPVQREVEKDHFVVCHLFDE